MHKTILLLLLLGSGWVAAQMVPVAASPVADDRALIIENSTMPLPTARATLIVGKLTRTNDVYTGDFSVKVFPYFFKSDHGRLAINIPDTALEAVNQGKTVTFTGTSTSAKNGIVRHIEITATPKDRDHGSVSLWFMVDDRKMTFAPAYRFTNSIMTTVPAAKS